MRILVLIYGGVAYLSFVASFTYAMGFISNVGVPKTIDSGGPGATLPTAIAINAALLMAFAVQHTVMARAPFKRWITRYIPEAAERATFVLASSAVLSLMMWQWRPMGGDVWRVDDPALRWILAGIAALGYAIVLYSSFLIDHFELFGLRQAWAYFRGHALESPAFVLKSLYRRVRHPLMLGFLIGFWATPHMTVGHLLFAVLVTGYILFGIQMEERDLVRNLGEKYVDYRARTPMLIPRVTRPVSMADAVKQVGAWGVLFFTVKGLAWVTIPLVVSLMS